ncbi:MAG: hypothetical protein ACK2UC_00920 [Anaerolineae bacterium]
MKNPDFKILLRNFLIELVIYSLLVVVYVYLVLRLLADPLEALFRSNLVVYAFLGLILILAQAVLLEAVTTFIVTRLKLERFE